MAKEICKVALKKYDELIWISLDKKHDTRSFVDTVACQFCLPTSADEREEDASETDKKEKNPVSVKTLLKALQEKMAEKLEKAKKTNKFVLLVLDGQVDMLHEDQNDNMGIERRIKEKILGLKSSTEKVDELRVLITRRKIEDADMAKEATKLKLERLSGKPASTLFIKHAHGRIFFMDEYGEDNRQELKPAMEAAVGGLKQLLRFAYDRKPSNSMIDCFWHSWNFLREHGGVNYNELIISWIMEGCLKHINEIDKAYVEGHAVLMKLMEYNMLKMQEDNIFVLEGATVKMDEYCRRGYWGAGDPGLASMLKGCSSS
ncbi:hypothetical protein F3Y22_tig00113722pilonHSYRG00287 [Hibiscus syriacus]|uniref:Uncharacterized protein n=1 Tax=Hibiscus syriacus TaxID=106335 RepID=A0A6A2XYW4_HIBSY|nr:putative disease resistance protein At4g19050 [Hibiscus syriacus]KAE8661907.1 hypothetical protein F3Y22_tig00113722pilonHSYRG00287 [Hibiscus syriacus]